MKVLFIGNSHTYFNDMPYMFRELCRTKGVDTHITMLTRGGQTLAGHAESEQVRFNILYGGYDYVVLQEVESEFPGQDAYIAHLKPLLDWVHTAGAKAVLYMNFAPAGDFARQGMLSLACRTAAQLYGLRIGAAGDAFALVQKAHPAIDLYFTDRRHASAKGSYLAAMCLMEAVTGIAPTGLSGAIAYQGKALLELPEQEVQALQEAAAMVQKLQKQP